MPFREYAVLAEDAPERVAEELAEADVLHVSVQDLDGETILDVPGTADPEGAAQQVLDAFDEFEGGGVELHLRVETITQDEESGPFLGRGFDDRPDTPDIGEPRSHGSE
jgi:hypothetical protein